MVCGRSNWLVRGFGLVCEGSDWFVGVQIGLSGLVAGFAPEPLETNPFHAANVQNLQALHFFCERQQIHAALGCG